LNLPLQLIVTISFTYNKRDFSGIETFGIRVIDPRAFLQEIGALT
jgi:hypothetical protein